MDEDDFLNDSATEIRQKQQALAVEFAKNYEVFVSDPRGAALLAHWDKALVRGITPIESSLQKYAADNALREFVVKIHQQIEIARERG